MYKNYLFPGQNRGPLHCKAKVLSLRYRAPSIWKPKFNYSIILKSLSVRLLTPHVIISRPMCCGILDVKQDQKDLEISQHSRFNLISLFTHHSYIHSALFIQRWWVKSHYYLKILNWKNSAFVEDRWLFTLHLA